MGSRYVRGESVTVAVASFAAGVAVCYLLLSRKNEAKKKYEIPAEILGSPYRKQVELAVRLALKAGKKIFSYCEQKGTIHEHEFDLGVASKGAPTDFCTKVDLENERIVAAGIKLMFPDHIIIGEEATGKDEIPPLTKTPTWLVDPIDGTTNFVAGLPFSCVSIGYCQDGKPAMGVVYAPMTGELYIAARGFGAFRNGIKIMTEKKDTPLSKAVVDFEFGYSREPEDISKMITVVEQIMNHGCRASRQLGSGVLDVCYVATGRLDVVYAGVANEGWKPWDFCAAYVVATESGCVFESFDQPTNQDFDLYSKNHICATNRGLLEEVRSLCSK